jgi:hypothetical protein
MSGWQLALCHRDWSFTPEGAKAVRAAAQAGR